MFIYAPEYTLYTCLDRPLASTKSFWQSCNQNFISGVFLNTSVPFLSFLFPSLFLSFSFPSLFSGRALLGTLFNSVSPAGERKRQLQPVDTFLGSKHIKCVCGQRSDPYRKHIFVYFEPRERIWWLQNVVRFLFFKNIVAGFGFWKLQQNVLRSHILVLLRFNDDNKGNSIHYITGIADSYWTSLHM